MLYRYTNRGIYIGEDKSDATDPPTTRHMQTWNVKTQDRKVGPSTNCASSQVYHVLEITNETQMKLKHHAHEISEPYIY